MIVWVLLTLGCLCTIVPSVAAVVAGDVYLRLHVMSPVATLGGPMIGAALVIANGWSLATAQIVLVVGLLAVTGPVLGAAIGRSTAERDGLVQPR